MNVAGESIKTDKSNDRERTISSKKERKNCKRTDVNAEETHYWEESGNGSRKRDSEGSLHRPKKRPRFKVGQPASLAARLRGSLN